MGYVVGLGPESKILFQSDNHGHWVAEILNVKVREINNFGNNLLFYFLHFFQSPVANMAANYICIKQKTKVYGEVR